MQALCENQDTQTGRKGGGKACEDARQWARRDKTMAIERSKTREDRGRREEKRQMETEPVEA